MLSNIWQCSLWPVQESRYGEFVNYPICKAVSCCDCVVPRRPSQWYERHHIDDSQSRVHTSVRCDVEQFETSPRQIARRLLANESEDTAIVVFIGVDVEEVIGDCCGEFAEHMWVGTFADIDDALEHPCYLARKSG